LQLLALHCESGNEHHQENQKQAVDALVMIRLEEACKQFSEWLSINTRQNVQSLGDELEVWNKILECSTLPDHSQQQWEDMACKNIYIQLQKVGEEALIEVYCQFSHSDIHPVIGQCLEDLAFKCVDRIIKEEVGGKRAVGNLMNIFLAKRNPHDHSTKLLRTILKSNCPKLKTSALHGPMKWFEHLLSWPLWATFLQFTADLRNLLGEEKCLVACAESTLIRTHCILSDGSISVTEFRLLESNINHFLELCKIWDVHHKPDATMTDEVKKSMQNHGANFDLFNNEILVIDNFVSRCLEGNQGMSEDLKELEHKIREDISSKQIKDLFQQNDSEADLICYFPVPPICRQFLQPMWNARDSDIFKRLWIEKRREISRQRSLEQPPNVQPLNLTEIASLICGPANNLWQEFCSEVQNGSILLERVSLYFGHLTSNSEDLAEELNCIDRCNHQLQQVDNVWKNERKEQIEQYFKLREKISAARALREVITVLQLKNNFPEVESICEQDTSEFRLQPIKILTNAFLSVGTFLAEFTSNYVMCLNSFTQARNLIQWLRDEIKEWKEMETFVELAGTKSTEGDLETTKINHLHAACAGFAPLLFELRPDATFSDLQHSCKKVFAAFDRDQELIRKWDSTGKCLESFKIIKKSLSSVEVSSFSELELINSRGRYHIGCVKNMSCSSLPRLTVDDCVRLVIEEKGEGTSGKGKVYLLRDLLDLESKLMLISGRSDGSKPDHVDIYAKVLHCVISIAKTFIKIIQAGNDKFLTWKCDFCCVRSAGSVHRESRDANVLKRDVNLLLANLYHEVKQLTAGLQAWNQEVEHFRLSHYYLNYFTTSQLLILRRELGSLACNQQYRLPGYVYALLGAVNPNCYQQHVSEAVLEAVSLACNNPQRDDHGNVSSVRLSINQGSPVSKPAVTGETLSEPVSYVSLDILGRALQQLASSSPISPKRSFATDHFHLGEPNLLVVPQDEIFSTILSLYMSDPEQSLPSAQEVLICSSSTLLEEVCLFWRKVLGGPDHRLFCLALADNLNYDVSRKSWEEFGRLVQGGHDLPSRSRYNLVIVCSAENEDRAYLVDALEAYRRVNLQSASMADMKRYLISNFQQAPAVTSRFVPAASLDVEGSSVRMVKSKRAGDGKSFFIHSIAEKLASLPQNNVSESILQSSPSQQLHIIVPLHDQIIDEDSVMEILRPISPYPDVPLGRLIHIDVLSALTKGLDTFLFRLLILGELSDSEGYIWRRHPNDLYVVEMTSSVSQDFQSNKGAFADNTAVKGTKSQETCTSNRITFLELLPTVSCCSPAEAEEFLSVGRIPEVGHPYIDDGQFRNENFQRAFQYLHRFANGIDLDSFKFDPLNIEGDHVSCLKTLQSNCGVLNPSWAEIQYFVNFFSSQLSDCENSDFCNPDAYEEDLPGFKEFVLRLMTHMSRDFSTRSLNYEAGSNVLENEIVQLRRRWEHSCHPYLFFDDDRHAMTFVGVEITRNGQLVDARSGRLLENIMSRDLSTALYTQGYRLQEKCENWSRDRKLEILCKVMGVENTNDPDKSYELTMDNVKKILAIQMRFRCGIPVILMGETGCGKTRLMRFMCALQCGSSGIRNMLLMKVHGGVTRKHIISKVKEAEALAARNRSQCGKSNIQTVLFFDEANTTESLGLFKEIICDGRVNGKRIEGLGSSLHVVAACNPYRKHSPEMIRRLEAAGLGYHVKSTETQDRLGHIPLRQLVYRVHALPDSMKSLVWDFGQLDSTIEKLYIKQIVSRHFGSKLSDLDAPGIADVVTNVLAAAQSFMRQQNDECGFVSLRDVERAMIVLTWFYDLRGILQTAMDKKHFSSLLPDKRPLDSVTRAFVLSLGVCYQARLHERPPFLNAMIRHFRAPCAVPGGVEQLACEIKHCQEVFLEQLDLPPRIARNHALSENVFMMIVCINLRIPLFLVGKPGSSKSLAKDVVKDAMKGQLSSSGLFQSLKQLHMISYQCSKLSTAEGIIAAFRQCQRAQEDRDTTRFVACVVLDEVGLAEDSPRLPLKALHPLLDDGTTGADDEINRIEQPNRIAFVGLSNWALDPAKMNRGILVNREVPDNEELVLSAKGICDDTVEKSVDRVVSSIDRLVYGMAEAYKQICTEQEREFFGLRDFYSLVKMVCAFCQFARKPPTWNQLEHAVRRNFGGYESVDAVKIFRRCFPASSEDTAAVPEDSIDNSVVGLIQANLQRTKILNFGDLTESRYLLLLTKNYAALNIIRQSILQNENPVIIFGSSFPKDQEYTQVCRTIKRIKVCMATGRTVVLLNLDQLYESLYDALNQYYVWHGGQRFVDLGLGNHRVKCLVHKDFRLILVAEREVVYSEFPIPLLNRMEKHFLAMESVLSSQQELVVEKVNLWARQFAEIWPEDRFLRIGEHSEAHFGVQDAFVGFNADTAATLVLHACRSKVALSTKRKSLAYGSKEHMFDIAVRCLLSCATPDAVARLHASSLSPDAKDLWNIYFCEQNHSSLLEYLQAKFIDTNPDKHMLIQVTTHSRLLSSSGVSQICSAIGMEANSIILQQFDTEQQFQKRLSEFYELESQNKRILLVQCEAGDINSDLIACSRYLIQEQRDLALNTGTTCGYSRHLVFVIQLPRVASSCFVGFQGGAWEEVHIDELRPANQTLTPSITSLANKKISSLLGKVVQLGSDDPVAESTNEIGSETMDDVNPEMCVEGPPVLNAEALLRACVHGAVSRLDEQEQSLDNASKRIHILLQLLPDDTRVDAIGCDQFYNQLKLQVIRLLEERDSRMDVEATTNWVRNEALSHNSLQVGGTFRRALWLRVINTVTPILAEIIAFLDRNFNLLMMEEAAAGVRNWLTTLWLDIFTSTLVSQHRYDFLSPLQNEVGQRVRIVSGGFRANAFQALFPFSGVIKSEVDVLMLEAKRMANERNETVHVALERLFKISELGAVIAKAQQCEEKVDKEISTRYLHDFVRMVYYATSEEEYKLVESAILCGWWELVGFPDEDPSGSVVLNVTIPTIHCSFEHIRSRIYCFREMVRIQPDIVLQLYQQIGAADRQELLVDVMAASMVLEGLRPDTSARQPKQHDQWLKRVQAAKPVVDSCMNLAFPGVIRNALWEENRNIWAACSAVKLFAEHTHSLAKDPFVSDAATKLYKCIKDVQVNFAKANTIGIIQRFLNESSKDYATKMFGPNGDECIICRTEWINKNPVSLTCKHIFCRSCLDRHLERSRNCPVCSTAIPENFQQSSNDQLILAGETYRSFRRCSTAFFMELLSVYSFCESASELPEQELVRMLMELVVQGPLSTRPFSPFSEDAIDPRPVVRSFILQLLLKYNLPVTMEYVEMVFANARKFIQGDNVGDMEDLCVLFVDCMEDSLHQHSCISPFDERIFTAVEELRNSRELLRAEKHTVRHLQGVAVARFGLTIAAQALGDLLVNNERAMSQEHDASMMSVPSNVNSPSIAQLLSAARVVINEDIEDPQLGLFLVKQLMRSKGLDIIDRLQEKYGLEVQWLAELLQQDANEAAIPDYFVVLGERYMRFREAVARTVASGEIRFIDDLVKKCAGQNVVVPILLAIYREITCVRALPLNRQIPHTVLTSVESHCNQGAVLPAWAKSHAADLINNSQGRPLPQLQVVPGIDAQNRCLAGLALHIFTTVSSCDGAGLVQPLHLMLTQPKTLENSFWPTMPEDYFMEARNLVQGTRWYECKNGHPYLVPNCGKPVVTLRCPDCGESIGMNTNDPNARTHASTQKGHVLGLATRRSQEATPERDLSPPACALIRLLMHGVLVWASCSQDQNVSSGVADVVRPPVLQENLPAFFWSHFELDSRLFAKAIGRSVEDSVVVVHKLLEHINKSRGTHQERVAGGRLVSVQERKEWETTFSQRYIAPVFKEMQTKMTDWLQNVMNDQNLGNNPVVRRVYELEQPGSSKSSTRLWRYRIRVSVDHLTHTLEQNMMSSECKLLREFLKQESKLRALQYLPDVVKLQRLLMDKYDGRISLQEARTFRVGRFLNSVKDREEKMKLERLIEKFNMAWGLIRNHVLSHGRLKPKNKDHELLYITKETPLAYLLPRTVDEGTCATALVDYLVNSVHNEFLVTYRRLSGSEWEPERVPLEFVTSAHLVAYDVEKDLMPLVLAHCDYSLSVGQGTNITYNLPALEKQIVDRFVNGKAHVEMKDCRIAFRKDVYNSSLFVRLQQRIRQEELPLSLQRQITSDFHDLTDVYSVLAVLDIAIGFIVSAGGSSDTMLHKYIHETLKMPAESGIVSTRAQQHCRLKHVRSLWRLLTVVKGRRLCLANQEPFEHVSPAYRVKMDAATCQSLEKALRKLNIEAFLLEMVEIITLELQRWEETANMEQYELRLAMEELYGSKLHGLNHIPPQVQLKHLLHCWKVAVKFESELSGTK
jgi:hypothetical protein